MENIRNYLETMFAGMPDTPEVIRAKDELYQMMEDKYNELILAGKSEYEAVGTVISEFGNLQELADDLGIQNTVREFAEDAQTAGSQSGNGQAGGSQSGSWQAEYGQAGGSQSASYVLNGKPASSASSKGAGKFLLFCLAAIVITLLCGVSVFLVFLAGNRKTHDYFGAINGPGQNMEVTYPLDAFSALDVEGNALSVFIEYGDSYQMHYEGYERLEPEYELDEKGTLHLKQKYKISPIKYGIQSSDCELHITLPANTDLEKIHINLNLGDINFDSILANTMDITADLGDVNMDSISANNLTVTADLGNVILKKNTVKEDITIEADLGNIELYDSNYTTGNFEADLGNLVVKDCSFDSTDAVADMGNIELGSRFNRVKAECSMGSVSLTGEELAGKEIDLKADMGSVTVNGEEKGNKFRQ